MPKTLRSVSFAAVTALLVACGGSSPSGAPPASVTPSGSPTSGPSGSPSSSPGAFGAVEHATGSTDVVLRFDEGGGFVGPAFLATQVPIFTLYGDGTIIFRNPASPPPAPTGSVQPSAPLRTARLSEDQIQALLESALGEGGLGAARLDYPNNQVADASTAVFTVNAGGLKKTVSVYALGIEGPGVQDALARAAFQKFAERLQDIDAGGAFPTAVYAADRYRGIVLDGQPGDAGAKPWPWDDLKPADFVGDGNPNTFQLPAHVLTIAHVEALGIAGYQGGFQGLTLIGPRDGKSYTFSLRPLLPDDPK